jgi:hypothetical protein
MESLPPLFAQMKQQRPEVDSPREFSEVIQTGKRGLTAFDKTLSSLSVVPFPNVNNERSMKDRISCLETTVEVQSVNNKLSVESFQGIAKNLDMADDAIRTIIKDVKAMTDATIAELKRDYDHK